MSGFCGSAVVGGGGGGERAAIRQQLDNHILACLSTGYLHAQTCCHGTRSYRRRIDPGNLCSDMLLIERCSGMLEPELG